MTKRETKRELTIRKLNALAESTTHAPEAQAARAKAEALVHKVTVQIAPASERDPGQVTFGFYVIDGNVMTMTDGEGGVVRREKNGEPYQHVLEPGQDPRPIAVRFTKEIRKAATGESMPGFYRRLNYSNNGIV